MKTGTMNFRTPLLLSITAFAVLAATTAMSRATPESVASFVCDDGDRFIVEYLDDHVRLRHGSGVFALAEIKSGRVYSDERLVLHTGESRATLELPSAGVIQNCAIMS